MSPQLPPIDIFRRAASLARKMREGAFENEILKDGHSHRFEPGLRFRPSAIEARILGRQPLTNNLQRQQQLAENKETKR
jgi:hypothetical protein